MLKPLLLCALVLTSCKLGPFPDEPVEQPEAPLPSGWIGGGAQDAGLADDAAAPVAKPDAH